MDVKKAGAVLLIPVDRIRTNPKQPRKHFDSAELASLGESIRRNGILQPLSVRAQDADGSYELIAGERRLRAAAESGFDRVPCIVINADSAQAAVYSVIENLQRRDLNFFEEALAIESLGEKFGLDRAQISEKLGKAPSTVSNKLRLLRLPEEVREKIIAAELTERPYYGVNSFIMSHEGFREKVIKHISHAYRIIFQGNSSLTDALLMIKDQVPMSKEIQHIIDFVGESKLGIVK